MNHLELAVPDDLKERDQWLLWANELRGGKQTKVPYRVGGRKASSTDPTTWTGFDTALEHYKRWPDRYSGLGFAFCHEDPFCGIDIDNCLDENRNPKPWVRGTIERFSDTYMEVSPSGRGLKIWARGSLPENLPGATVGDGQIEIYDHARYFTVTGRAFRGAPLQVEDHAEDIRLLYEHLRRPRKSNWLLQPLPGGRIPHGQQHNTLVSIAGTLRARHVCDEAIEACLQIVSARQCEQPGPAENISRIVRSSRRWGATA
jgi:primase-polymerase (primpol)-like protein